MCEGQARIGREVQGAALSVFTGMPFLSKWRVTLDLARSRVWFQPGDTGEATSTAR